MRLMLLVAALFPQKMRSATALRSADSRQQRFSDTGLVLLAAQLERSGLEGVGRGADGGKPAAVEGSKFALSSSDS